jgi:hypothetical protein
MREEEHKMAATVKRGVKEKLVEAELLARIEAAGGLCIKVQAIGRRGFFDRIVVLPGGKVIFVELKRPRGGMLAKHQIWYLAGFNALAVAVAVVRCSADIDRLLT